MKRTRISTTKLDSKRPKDDQGAFKRSKSLDRLAANASDNDKHPGAEEFYIYKLKKQEFKKHDHPVLVNVSSDCNSESNIEEELPMETAKSYLKSSSTTTHSVSINLDHSEVHSLDGDGDRDGDDIELDLNSRMDVLKGLTDIPYWDDISDTTSMELQYDIDRRKSRKSRKSVRKIYSASSHAISVGKPSASEQDMEETSEDVSVFGLAPSPSLVKVGSSELDSNDDDEDSDNDNDIDIKDDDLLWTKPKSVVEHAEVGFPDDFHASKIFSIPTTATSRMTEAIRDFLNDLLDSLVSKSEVSDSLLGKRLDKRKLFKQLEELVHENLNERYRFEYLHSKITDYHVRRLQFSQVTPTKNTNTDRIRYNTALNELDHWLEMLEQIQEHYHSETDCLKQQLKAKKENDEALAQEMENSIRNILLTHRQVSERLNYVMELFFTQMRTKRQEISTMRLELLDKQHQYSQIEAQIDKINTITPDLKMHTFLTVEIDVQQLTSNINSRNHEIERMSTMIMSKIHSISHLRCRRKLLSRRFREATNELKVLYRDLLKLREKLLRCNLIRNNQFQQIKDVRVQSGLIHFPLLLKDFDDTVEQVAEREVRVTSLRTQRQKLEEKILKIESHVELSDSVAALRLWR